MTKEVLKKRLREQLHEVYRVSIPDVNDYRQTRYNAMREFCLDCELLTFNEIEKMEFEIKQAYEMVKNI